MRIKIIGDNNCARATRHLLRLAGFAVTEFLPVDAITQAPHFGFAITIDCPAQPVPVPSSGHTPPAFVPNSATSAGLPACLPDPSTHGQPTPLVEGASVFAHAKIGVSSIPICESLADEGVHEFANGTQAEACATGASHIHFDSVDSVLEAAVLRHVTQLAAGPVIVDRPGGVVHSERELRIVLPYTGDAKVDEAAAVAVEFGVLRGLLDLTSPRSASDADKSLRLSLAEADSSAVAPGSSRSVGGKKWWKFGAVIIAAASLTLATGVNGRLVSRNTHGSAGFSLCGLGLGLGLGSRTSTGVGIAATQVKSTQAEACATGERITHAVVLWDTRTMIGRALGEMPGNPTVTNGAYLRLAALGPAAAQGEFGTGQQTKLTDGTNTLVIDPCKGQAKSYVSINQTANAQLAAGTASKKIYICSIHVVVAAATNVALVEGTGTVCATSTTGVSGFGGATAATGWNFAANGGIVLGNGDVAVGAEGTSGDNLCLYNSAAGQVSGGVSYVVQ